MQIAMQHRRAILPTIPIAVAAVSITLVVLALALSLSRTHSTISEDIVPTPVATRQPLNVSPSPGVATNTGDTLAQSVPLWSSEIMDSHESVQSLAALAKSGGNKAKPRQESSVSAEPGLALLDSTAPEQTR